MVVIIDVIYIYIINDDDDDQWSFDGAHWQMNIQLMIVMMKEEEEIKKIEFE